MEAPGGTLIAEDIQLGENNAFALIGYPDRIRAARAADELLEVLVKAYVLLDHIRETCEYEKDLPVTFLEIGDIEIIHGDAITGRPAIRALLWRLGRAA